MKKKKRKFSEHHEIIEMCTNVLDKIVANPFLMGTIYVAKHDDPDLFGTVAAAYVDTKNAIAGSNYHPPSTAAAAAATKPFEELLKRIATIDINQLDATAAADAAKVESITYCLQPLLAVKVLLNPNSDTQHYVNDLLMIQRLKNYSMPRLYCETIRACLMSLYVSGTARESIWCAFTFIKVPQIIKQLNALSKSRDYDDAAKLDYSPDVIEAFEMLAEDPILDFMDTKCACNTIEFLLTELAKQHLVNDKHVKHFSSKR